MKEIKNILVVCTGNSCRSIMAEAYLRKRLEEEGSKIKVLSAGTLGIDGMLPPKETIKILETIEVNADKVTSTAITPELIKKADLILVMETYHLEKIKVMSPKEIDKVVLLKQFDPEKSGDISIPDPIGRSLAFYKASFGMIKQSVEGLISWLKI